MDSQVAAYFDNTQRPWGKLFYRQVWEQLPSWKGQRLLDFGSGFGITAAHLAAENQVTAVEPNQELLELAVGQGMYRQLVGSAERLPLLQSSSFDGILCHNVLEYTPEQRREIVEEFVRLLKPGGTLSIVKHNHAGRVMQKAVFENCPGEAARLLEGGALYVRNFGQVHYYLTEDLLGWGHGLVLDKVLGVRTFFALPQDNARKEDPAWQEDMFRLECLAAGQDPYRQVAFFHHVLLNKQ